MKAKLISLLLATIASIVNVNAEVLTVAQAIEVTLCLDDGATSSIEYTIEGYVVDASVYDFSKETQTWNLVDDLNDMSLKFQAYHCVAIEGGDTLKVINGDKVRITGKLTKYHNPADFTFQPEIKNGTATFVSKVDENHTINREAIEINVTQALEIGNTLFSGEYTEQRYHVIGFVKYELIRNSTNEGFTYSFWLTDSINDSNISTRLYAYRCKSSQELKIGDRVTITSQIYKYNQTCEVQGTINLLPTINVSAYPENKGLVRIIEWTGDRASSTVVISAEPSYGYHFEKWNDGVMDNPRTIVLTQDTTFIAEFAKNEYTITTESNNSVCGTTAGDTTALYLDEVSISATPNYGYHFVRWNDNNTSNPRTVTITENKTYQAIFAKNVYSITKVANSTQGAITGNSSAEYLDEVELTAVPNYGYHFTQWSDGVKDNPRSFVITQDTTFTAEFALDRSGKCGNDLALTWEYDAENQVLTISGEGAFNENMQCGVEAKPAMTHLVIDKGVTSIGENAFNGCSYLSHLTLGESVKTINNNAFYNCVNLETIINYRPTPTNAYSTAFDGVDKFECKLYVLASSIDMYKAASVWRDFYYTYAIGAEGRTITTDTVAVEPGDNMAVFTWPTDDNAASYTIQITKDGVVFCTLIFNANGQLTGIAFAPSRNGSHNAPAAVMTANGLQFTITGLNSGTNYAFTLQAKDDQEIVLASYTGDFTTTGEAQVPTAIENTPFPSGEGWGEATKVIRDGQIFILRGDKTYTVTGQEIR